MPLWTGETLKTREVNDGSRTREGCRNAAASPTTRWAETRPKVAQGDGRSRPILPCQGGLVGREARTRSGGAKRGRGSDQSISIEERSDLHPPCLQGGGGDAGRISDIGKAAHSQVGRQHK